MIQQRVFSEIDYEDLHHNILPLCFAPYTVMSTVIRQVTILLSWKDAGSISQNTYGKQGFHITCWLCNQLHQLSLLQLEDLTAKFSKTTENAKIALSML